MKVSRITRAVVVKERGVPGFYRWLRATQPGIYESVIRRMKPQTVSGLGFALPGTASGETSTSSAKPSFWDKLNSALATASQAYLSVEQLKAQKKLLATQLQRAQAGLAPLDIDPAAYGITGPQVSVGMSSQTKTFLVWGGVALGAVYLLPKLIR